MKMPGEELNEKTVIDLMVTGGTGAALAICFQIIRASREHMGEPFNARRFIVGLFSAGGVGALIAWTLDALNVNRELSAVIIAMGGYVGGPLLDICYQEIQETLQAAFDGVQKWLNEGKWDK